MPASPEPNARTPEGSSNPAGLLALGLGVVAANTRAGLGDGDIDDAPELGEFLSAKPDLELFGCLGHGGMGVVYRARQVRLDRDVAVKLMNPELSREPEFAARFEREARALARLDHPGIVRVHEFGEAAGVHYLVLELVDGPNLRELASEGLDDRMTLEIVDQLCDALAYAHEQGVVHRDIKPENVLVDRRGRVRLADFGLAKLRDEHRRAPTRTRRVMGTPQYMAPEQLGAPHAVDERCDIFALGVVLYEMLTGQLPVGRFPAPSELGHGDPALDQVVLRALESRRDLRYQSITELKTALATTRVTARARPDSARPHRRTLRAFAFGGAAAAIVVSATAIWVWDPPALSIPRVEQHTVATAGHAPPPPEAFKQLNRWPAQELASLDPDVIGVVGIDWSELRQAPIIERLSGDLLADHPDVFERVQHCTQTVVEQPDKVLVAFDDEQIRELVLRGDWQREAVDRCLDDVVAATPAIQERRLGAFRQLTITPTDAKPTTMTIAHGDSTLLIALRPDITAAEIEAKLAGEPTSKAFRDRVLQRADLSAPIWFAAEAPTLPFEARAVSGSLELWERLSIDASAEFADADAAASAKTLVQSYIVVAQTMIDFPSPPKLEVEVADAALRLRGTVELPEPQRGEFAVGNLEPDDLPPPLAEHLHGRRGPSFNLTFAPFYTLTFEKPPPPTSGEDATRD